MKRILAIAAAGLLAATAFGAQAATAYNVVTDFGASEFSYGGGHAGQTFSSLAYTAADCVGTSGLSCYNNPANASEYTFPAIGKNTTGGTLNFYTNSITPQELFVQAPQGSDAIIRFTAPTAGWYQVDTTFARADTTNNGDGSLVGVYSGDVLLDSQSLASSWAGPASSYTFNFDQRVFLAAGGTLDFFQNAKDNIYWDGTSFAGTITAVPEPGVWAMMIAGLAMAGAMLRRRRNSAFAAVA
jgi:hypothetical protein